MKQDIRNVVAQYIQNDELVEAITDEIDDVLNRKYLVEEKYSSQQLPDQSEPGVDY